ncbi:MAG: MFS transporter [Anaerolineae bacterium]
MADRGRRAENVALLTASLSSFLTSFLISAMNVALPSIGRALSMSAVGLAWVTTSYLLTAAMSLVPFGKAADLVGRKRVFTWGVLLFTVSSLLAAISPTGAVLIASRVPQGIGGAMIACTIVAILTAVFPADQRGRALGISVSATYLGLSLGPLLGGLLTQQLGWRSIFLINVPLGLIVAALVVWGLEGEPTRAEGKGFDILGSALYGLSLLATMYGLSRLPGRSGVWFLGGGAVGIVGFGWWETRSESPVVDLRLFQRNHLFALSNVTALLAYIGTFSVSFLLSLYLQHIKALTPQQAGVILVARPAMMAAFSPAAGRLSDRVEPRVVASMGLGLMVLGLALLLLLDRDANLALVVASLVLSGLGFALFSSPNANAIMSAVQTRFYGVASAVMGTMRLIGQMLSMGIATLIIALYVGEAELTPDRYPMFLSSVRVAVAVSMAVSAGGVISSLARGEVR